MPELTPETKQALTATVAHWRDTDLDTYAELERGRAGHIELLLEPETEAELAALVQALRAHGVQTCTIAGQSGLVEAQRPHGVAIGMWRFDAIGELTLPDGARVPPEEFASVPDRTEGAPLHGATLRVGAGVAIDTVNAALAPAGLKLPIVMGSTGSATAGACAANASAGANAVRYGTAADMAVHVRGVLGTGEVVAEDVPPRPPVTDPDQCVIRADRFLHGASLVGSQGALGLVTEVTYRLYPVARDQAALLLPVPDVATAIHLRDQLAARFASETVALELFEIIRHQTLQRALAHAELALRDGAREAPYYALVLLVSDEPGGESMFGSTFAEAVVTHAMTALTGPDGAPCYPEGDFDFDHDPHRLLEIREACSEMSRLLPKQSYDVVVPPARLDRFVADLEATMADAHPAFELSVFGHAGVGALHLHAIASDDATLARHRDAIDALVFDLVQAHHGSPWAEHGVGRKWGEEWRRRTPRAVQEEMLRLKRACDPDNVLGSRLFGFDTLLADAGDRPGPGA
jgi:FAD/FMN-containing dehydrogenase